jgi:hypothetical protein
MVSSAIVNAITPPSTNSNGLMDILYANFSSQRCSSQYVMGLAITKDVISNSEKFRESNNVI